MTKAQQNLLEELFQKKATAFKKQASKLVVKSESFILDGDSAICLKNYFMGIGAPKKGDIYKSKNGDIIFIIEEKCAEECQFSENIAGEIISLPCLKFKIRIV